MNFRAYNALKSAKIPNVLNVITVKIGYTELVCKCHPLHFVFGQLMQEGSYVRSVVLLEIRTMQKLDLTGIYHYFPSSSSYYYYYLLCPATKKVAGYFVIPSEILGVRPSVCLSARPSVRRRPHHSCARNSIHLCHLLDTLQWRDMVHGLQFY